MKSSVRYRKPTNFDFNDEEPLANALDFIIAHEAATGLPMGQRQKDAITTLYDMMRGIGTPNGTDITQLFIDHGTLFFPLCPVNDTTALYEGYDLDFITCQKQGDYINMTPSNITVDGVLSDSNTKYFRPYKTMADFPLEAGGHFIYHQDTLGAGLNAIPFGAEYNGAGDNDRRTWLIPRQVSNQWSYCYWNGNWDASIAGGRQFEGLMGMQQRFLNNQNPRGGGLWYVHRDGFASVFGTFVGEPSNYDRSQFTFHNRGPSSAFYPVRLSTYIMGTPFFGSSVSADLSFALDAYHSAVTEFGRAWFNDPAPSNSDAANFIVAHETATGQSMGTEQKVAIDGFVERLQGNGTTNGSDIWSKLVANGTRLWPLCPIDNTTANATAYNMELISNTALGSYVNFVPGDFTPNGVIGGATKTFNSGVSSNNYASDNFGFGFYSRTNSINNLIDAGSNTADNYIQSRATLDRFIAKVNSTGSGMVTTNTDSRGLFQTQTTSSTTANSVRNGNEQGVDIQTRISNGDIFTFHGVGTSYSARQLSMYFVGMPYLTAAELQDFQDAVHFYQSTVIAGGRFYFNPTELANGQLYLRADQATRSAWTSAIGTPRVLAQGTSSQQPLVLDDKVKFDGINDIQYLAEPNVFAGDSSGVIYFSCFWDGSNVTRIISSGDEASSNVFLFDISPAGKARLIKVPGNEVVDSVTLAVPGYNHVAIRSDGATTYFTMNASAEEVGIASQGSNTGAWWSSLPTNRDNLTVGGFVRNNTNYYADELNKIYYNNGVLTAKQEEDMKLFMAHPTNY